MAEPVEEKTKKLSWEVQVICERCQKPLGAGDCARCRGVRLAKVSGINVTA